jgi:hypothetical protein
MNAMFIAASMSIAWARRSHSSAHRAMVEAFRQADSLVLAPPCQAPLALASRNFRYHDFVWRLVGSSSEPWTLAAILLPCPSPQGSLANWAAVTSDLRRVVPRPLEFDERKADHERLIDLLGRGDANGAKTFDQPPLFNGSNLVQ